MSIRGSIFIPVSAVFVHSSDVAHFLAVDVVLHKFFDHTTKQKHNGWFWLPTTEEVIGNMRQAYASLTTADATANYANARRDPKEVCATVSDTLTMLIILVL